MTDVDYTKEPRYIEIQDEIQALPGMRTIKEQVSNLVAQAMMEKSREAAGLPPEPMNNNMILTGNPGTGKTTMTRKLGELMFELGMSKSPKIVQLTRADLVGPYSNQAAEHANAVITKNRGKTLFIDEAYTLYTGPSDHEGRQVLDEVMRLAEEMRDDTPIVLAGTPDEMEAFVAVNPGMPSRFPAKMNLPDYEPPELAQVLHYIVADKNRTYDSPATKRRATRYAMALPSGGERGNARAVRNFYDTMRIAQAARLQDRPDSGVKELSEFVRADLDVAAARFDLEPIRTARTAPRKPNPAAAQNRAGYRGRVATASPGRA